MQLKYPRLKLLLQQYHKGEITKKAEVLSLSDIFRFLNMKLSTPYWIVRKAATAIAFAGGLRCAELRALTIEGCTQDQSGYWFDFVGAKQRKVRAFDHYSHIDSSS